jgi:hypothetical protein
MGIRRGDAGSLAARTSLADPGIHGRRARFLRRGGRDLSRHKRDPQLAVGRATWARDHALGLVAHLRSIGLRGEAAAAANIVDALDGALELPRIPPTWRSGEPHLRVIP